MDFGKEVIDSMFTMAQYTKEQKVCSPGWPPTWMPPIEHTFCSFSYFAIVSIESSTSFPSGFVKSPSAVLCSSFVIPTYEPTTPHAKRFARLASGAFSCAVYW